MNDNYPSNTVYGVNSDSSFRSYLAKDYAFVGYFLSLVILLTHCVFVGNGVMYKMDNLIILAQSVFFFLFVRVLTSNPVGQFYFGWSWMLLGFFPNYFSGLVSSTSSTAPPYALFYLDANFIRNAGSHLSILLTFVLLWAVVSLICYLVEVRLRAYEIWFWKIYKNSMLAML